MKSRNRHFTKKMFLRFFLVLLLVANQQELSAQTLADVVSSVQERRRVTIQRTIVFKYFEDRRNNFSSSQDHDSSRYETMAFPLYRGQTMLAVWNGVSAWPENDATADGLNLGQCVELLNRAALEFDEIKGEYLNISDDAVAYAATAQDFNVGAIRNYTEYDLPTLGLVTEANYQEKLQELAVKVRCLSAIGWPAGGLSAKVSDEKNETGGSWGPETLEMPAQPNPGETETFSITDRNGYMVKKAYCLGTRSHTKIELPPPTSGEYPGHYDGTWPGPEYGILESQKQYKHQVTEDLQKDLEFRISPKDDPSLEFSGTGVVLTKLRYTPSTALSPADGVRDIRSHAVLGCGAIKSAGGSDEAVPGIAAHGQTFEIKPEIEPFTISGKFMIEVSGQGRTATFQPTGFRNTEVFKQIPPPFQGGESPSPTGLSDLYRTDLDDGIKWEVFSREYLMVMIPEFKTGIDRAETSGEGSGGDVAVDALANLNSMPITPANSQIQPIPAPGVLFSIPLGAGIKGISSGSLAILNPGLTKRSKNPESEPINPADVGLNKEFSAKSIVIENRTLEWYSGVPGFDSGFPSLGSDLRFIGSQRDFKVFYESDTESAEHWGRFPKGTILPKGSREGGLFAGHQTYSLLDCEMLPSEFINAWERPRISQIIGRHVIVQLSYDHLKLETEIGLFHRSASDEAHLTINAPIPPSELASTYTQFLSYKITPGGGYTATDEFTLPDAPFSVEIDGGDDQLWKIASTKVANGPLFSKTEVLVKDDDTTEAAMTLTIDGEIPHPSRKLTVSGTGSTPLSATAFSLAANPARAEQGDNGDSSYPIAHLLDPNTLVTQTVSGNLDQGENLKRTVTFVPDSRRPRKITVTSPNEAQAEYHWHWRLKTITDPNSEKLSTGVPEKTIKGPWGKFYSASGDGLKIESKLDGQIYEISWLEWRNQGSVVTSESDPHAPFQRKPTSETVTKFAMSGPPSKIAPWAVISQNSAGNYGSRFEYLKVPPSHSALQVTETTGLLNGEVVTQGYETVTKINQAGRIYFSEYSRIAGPTLSGFSGTGASELTWGFPTMIQHTYPVGENGQAARSSTLTVNDSFPLIDDHLDQFGVESKTSSRDIFQRVAGFKFHQKSGLMSYNSGGINTGMTFNGATTVSERDILGRPKGTDHDGQQQFTTSINYGAAKTSVSYSNATTSATTKSVFDAQTGSFLSNGTPGQSNLEIPITGSLITVETEAGLRKGLLKTRKTLKNGSYLETWSDGWGRPHYTETPTTGTTGGGVDITEYLYSEPGVIPSKLTIKETTQLPKNQQRWTVQEITPYATIGAGIPCDLSKHGVDVTQTEGLTHSDRFVLVCKSYEANAIKTTVSTTANDQSTGLGPVERFRVTLTPSTGETVFSENGGVDTTVTPAPDGGSVSAVSERGWQGVTLMNQLGQVTFTAVTGKAVPSSTTNLYYRNDFSLDSVRSTHAGSASALELAPDGRIQTINDPIRGSALNVETLSGGKRTINAFGNSITESFDGTSQNWKQGGVTTKERRVIIAGGGAREEIEAPEVSQVTTTQITPGGVPESKNYPAGPSTGVEWYPGQLLKSVRLGRAVDLNFSYSNDGARDLASITYPAVSGFGSVVENFQTGADGEFWEISDRSGTRELDWDSGRLQEADYIGSGGILDGYRLDYSYDLGRRTGVMLTRGNAALHEVTFARNNGSSPQLTGVSTGWMAATYERDPGSQRIMRVARGLADLTYGRDHSRGGRLTRVGSEVAGAPSFKYQRFDNRGRRKVVLSSQGNWNYDYDGKGQLVSARQRNGPSFVYDVDAIGRRAEFRESSGMGPSGGDGVALNQPIGAFGGGAFDLSLHLYGQSGAKFYLRDHQHAAARLYPGIWADYSFVKDATYQGEPGVEKFRFDQTLSQFPYGGWYQWAIKGVLTNQGETGAYQDAVAEVAGLTWINPTHGNYSHDADGNRDAAPGWNYGWDGRNRLVAAETEGYASNPTGKKLSFEYDAEGRRVQKVVWSKVAGVVTEVRTHFVWDGWHLLYERRENASGGLLMEAKYVWGADLSGTMGGAGGAGGMLAMQVNGVTYYPLFDGSGNVVGLADQGGALVAEYRYGPFGELISATGPAAAGNPWRFGTKYHDLETNLTYFGHRYFDSVTGSWLSREPLGEGESLNLYAYCHGDPINNVDVLGLAEKSLSGDAIVNPREEGGFSVFIPVLEQRWVMGSTPAMLSSNGFTNWNQPQEAGKYVTDVVGHYQSPYIFHPGGGGMSLQAIMADSVSRFNGQQEIQKWEGRIGATKTFANFLPGGRAGVLAAEGNFGGAALSFGTDGLLTFTGGKWIKNATSVSTKIGRGVLGGAGIGALSESSIIAQDLMGGADIDPYNTFIRIRNAAGQGAVTGGILSNFVKVNSKMGVNLASPQRTKHILTGDATGGGHKFGFTRLFNGKTKFPAMWNKDRIMRGVSEVATNPANKWIQQTGKPGSLFTKAGDAVKFKVEGMFDGVNMRVIIQGDDIITAFPIR